MARTFTDFDRLLTSPDPAIGTARRLALDFRERGHELFLVGGAVRAVALGLSPDELDFATDARPETTLEMLKGRVDGGPYEVGFRFGTIGAVIDAHRVEITTYRSHETYALDSRKPDVQFGRSIEEDLARRDFTINAVAIDPTSGDLIDPYHGLDDIADRLIRAVGNPADRFREDPLRLLRAVRFAAALGFAVDADSWAAMKVEGTGLGRISRERIRDEYSKILTAPRPSHGLALLRDSDLMRNSVPELLELDAMPDHGPRHPLSLWDHVMRVVDTVPAGLEVRWAALLHDIGKPSTRTREPDGRIRFFHHEEVGASMARRLLAGLRYPSDLIARVTLLVATHMNMHAYSPEWSDGAVRRLILKMGPCLPDALVLARADASGHTDTGAAGNLRAQQALEARIASIAADQASAPSSPLDGRDLMERYGRPPGPWIRAIKDVLLDAVIDGELLPEDRDAAFRLADSVADEIR